MANTQTWGSTVPSGVTKSNKLDDRLIEASLEKSVMFEHVNHISGFGKNQGDTVTIERVSNLTEQTSYVLSETDRIPIDDLTLSTVSGTVDEIGRGVRYTDKMRQLSKFDPKQIVQKRLMDQMTKAVDTIIATAAKLSQYKYACTGVATSNIATGGTFGATSTSGLKVWHLNEIYDILYDTLHAEPVAGNDYFGVFRHTSLRTIHNDPDFRDWYKYTTSDKIANFEIGKVSNIRLIDTNHSEAFENRGTGSVLGEGVVFGRDWLQFATIVKPELRFGETDDFQRKLAVAWVGIIKAFLTWGDSNAAGEANSIHIGSL